MTAPAWYNEGKKLLEGETYVFEFIRLVPLSDHMNYMLMEDKFGIRHLVPYEFYLRYNLRPGSRVRCRVDKINCTGRVFLEPEHPVYKAGHIAGFRFLEIRQARDTDSGLELCSMFVEDVFGNRIGVEVPGALPRVGPEGMVHCMVEGLKKGRPVLSLPPMDRQKASGQSELLH